MGDPVAASRTATGEALPCEPDLKGEMANAAPAGGDGLLARAFSHMLIPFALYDEKGVPVFEYGGFLGKTSASRQSPLFSAALINLKKMFYNEEFQKDSPRHSLEFSDQEKLFKVLLQFVSLSDSRFILATLHDVTQENQALEKARRAEKKLKDFVGCSSEWAWETDTKGRFRMISAQLGRLIGKSPASLLGRRFQDIGAFTDTPLVELSESEAFRLRQPLGPWRFDLETGDGKTVAHNISAVPVFDEPGGGFLGYRGTGTDISRRLEATEALRACKRELSHALSALQDKNTRLQEAFAAAESGNRTKEAFLRSIDHEVQEPLHWILSCSDAIRKETSGPVGNPKYLDYCEDINKSARHLLELVSGVLYLAGSESPDVYVPKVVDLVDESRFAVRLIEAEAAAKAQKLSVTSSEPQVFIRSNPPILRQILGNLLTNAVKFTPPGGTIGVEVDHDQDKSRVRVCDTGIGIPKEDLERVFEPFERSSLSYVRDQAGSGLGLALCKRLTALVGGELSLESTEGRGTIATLCLPAADIGNRRL
ncbi:MAG: PAS domain S-box protein [Alphaproteobacteria bacterium]|jgi:PAS domain S-box-containing protein|nr:PAS domain S-box protein [Alphaproteobacteria bacterium]